MQRANKKHVQKVQKQNAEGARKKVVPPIKKAKQQEVDADHYYHYKSEQFVEDHKQFGENLEKIDLIEKDFETKISNFYEKNKSNEYVELVVNDDCLSYPIRLIAFNKLNLDLSKVWAVVEFTNLPNLPKIISLFNLVGMFQDADLSLYALIVEGLKYSIPTLRDKLIQMDQPNVDQHLIYFEEETLQCFYDLIQLEDITQDQIKMSRSNSVYMATLFKKDLKVETQIKKLIGDNGDDDDDEIIKTFQAYSQTMYKKLLKC
eukprot:403354082